MEEVEVKWRTTGSPAQRLDVGSGSSAVHLTPRDEVSVVFCVPL